MKSFLQSEEWAEFQKSLGRKVWQIESINVFKHDLPLKKNYLYSPRCGEDFLSESFSKNIREIAKKESSVFLKVEPSYIKDSEDKSKFKKFEFKKSTTIQPQRTIILDITKSEQELLNQMHQKTRYNIKLADKKGVVIKKGTKKDIEKFWLLLNDTVKRDGFCGHIRKYYEKMLDIPRAELFIAEFKGKIIAANIVLFYNKQAIYLHGASDYNYRNLMAPHLLQWEQIKEAKKRGYSEYDFWGIDEKKWPGVTRFKKGFGGREVSYIGAYDLIFNKFWYGFYKIARSLLTRFR